MKPCEALVTIPLIIVYVEACLKLFSFPSPQSSSVMDDEDDSPAAFIYIVNQSDLNAFLKEKVSGPGDSYVSTSGSYVVIHRNRRQVPPQTNPAATNQTTLDSLTPVLPITGKKDYDETDCMPWEEIAVIIRSSLRPKDKSDMIEPKCCNLKNGLECMPVEETKGSGITRQRCRCLLAYGPKPARVKTSKGTKCYIPAGQGWVSECYNKSWNSYGSPLPYGDPSGANAEPAVQTDAVNKPDGEQVVIDYIKWNSIKPACVPNAECREGGYYIGQRCKCRKGTRFNHSEGTCKAKDSD